MDESLEPLSKEKPATFYLAVQRVPRLARGSVENLLQEEGGSAELGRGGGVEQGAHMWGKGGREEGRRELVMCVGCPWMGGIASSWSSTASHAAGAGTACSSGEARLRRRAQVPSRGTSRRSIPQPLA